MLFSAGFLRKHRNPRRQALETGNDVIVRRLVGFGNRRAVRLVINPKDLRAEQPEDAAAGLAGQLRNRLDQAGQVRRFCGIH